MYQPVVGALFRDVGDKAAGPGDQEQRRKYMRRQAAHFVNYGGVVIQIGKHLLFPPHNGFNALCNVVKRGVACGV